LINNVVSKKVDTWDYQWVFNCVYSYGLCVTPSANLISNLGVDGAHANGRTENNFLPTYEVDLNKLVPTKWVVPNMYHDQKVALRNFKISYLTTLKRSLKKIINLVLK
jgi:hypothetical protein